MKDETRKYIELSGSQGVYPQESASIDGEDAESPGVFRLWEYLGHSAERVWTVPTEEKDWLLLNLLKECWPVISPTPGDFPEWLDAHGIAYKGWAWASYD